MDQGHLKVKVRARSIEREYGPNKSMDKNRMPNIKVFLFICFFGKMKMLPIKQVSKQDNKDLHVLPLNKTTSSTTLIA